MTIIEVAGAALMGIVAYELLRQFAKVIARQIGKSRRRKIEVKRAATQKEKQRRKELFLHNLRQVDMQ